MNIDLGTHLMIHTTCNAVCPANCNSSNWYTYKKVCGGNDLCHRDFGHKDDNITIRCGNVRLNYI